MPPACTLDVNKGTERVFKIKACNSREFTVNTRSVPVFTVNLPAPPSARKQKGGSHGQHHFFC